MVNVDALNTLAQRLSPGAMITDPDLLQSYRQDWSFDPAAGTPIAVVRASTTADVQETLRFANSNNVPVIPRGAGTSVVGGSTAVDGAITLSLERMKSIRVDVSSRTAIVEPGAITNDVKAVAAREGLYYPPDPSSYEICSIGGNAATNAGGPCCIKYGVTSDYILGMTVVLPDGSVAELGGKRIKDTPGLALTKLFVGSEGTLGVITELTLRLIPQPPTPHTLVAFFPLMADAVAAARDITSSIRPSELEILDNAAIKVAEEFLNMELDTDAGALLIGRSDAGNGAETEMKLMSTLCEKHRATATYATDDPHEGELFIRPRYAVYEAFEQKGVVIGDDVAVPIDRLPELTDGIADIAKRYSTTIVSYTHAADELTHPVLNYPIGDVAAAESASAARQEIYQLVSTLGGFAATEYGVGQDKRDRLSNSLDPVVSKLNRTIKNAIDPNNILNPRVLIPSSGSTDGI
ncbi:FAD-linked oxidase [Rhodococcus erythropolis]|uniref:FAD-binding oxidoreductase n=1 Tax=Rhodococcus erythropolis TaxID=1833 RepID=UPI00061B66C5|nr:FAD-binding oxidoreductase [Rhodococcus erythropolis]AKD96367.1 FAD-linked oxidase [Rhodococcus erythropolis]